MKRSYRRLLPSGSTDEIDPEVSLNSSPNAQRTLPDARNPIRAACENCRVKKTKCNGERPSCRRCVVAKVQCVYRAAEGETHSAALKRQSSSLAEEVEQLRQLFSQLRARPYLEALEIFSRVRQSEDPLSVLQYIKQAEILLPRSVDNTYNDPTLAKADTDALNNSHLSVPAHPWTSIAGDGLVSSLVSLYFAVDHNFLVPLLNASLFLHDMRNKSAQEDSYCSPTLVNAICALKCLASPVARQMSQISGDNLAEMFLKEAKRLFELEYGRVSIPAIVSLCLMYLTSAVLGRDRAGTIYRNMAYNMAKRLQLEVKFTKINPANSGMMPMRHLYSRTLWGLFCFESRMSYFYSEPSLIEPPSIPNLFRETDEFDDNYPARPADSLHRATSGTFKLLCQLSKLFYKIMVYNKAPSTIVGSPEDLHKRAALYSELKLVVQSMDSSLKVADHFTAQNGFLQTYISETAFSIMQLISAETTLDGETLSVKDLCLRLCEADSDVIWQHFEHLDPDPLLCRGLYVSLTILVPFLDDEAIHRLFSHNCFMLKECTTMTPLATLLLKSIEASAWSLKKQIPAAAKQYFEHLQLDQGNGDVPITFSLPHSDEIRRILSADENDDLGVQLSELVSKWSSMSTS